MTKPRTTCPSCNRNVAIVSKSGGLAYHRCEPVDLTEARANVIRHRGARERAVQLRREVPAVLRRALVRGTTTTVVLGALGGVGVATSSVVWLAWIAVVAAGLVALVTGWFIETTARAVPRLDAAIVAATEKCGRAVDELRAVEASLPLHVVFPEVYPAPEDPHHI